jgi:xylulose-5-phosphate/fructose-6-phosphate phosphoketolase
VTSATPPAPPAPLSESELHALDAYWRAANYLSVGQIYLRGNALLREPLTLAHVKPRLLGHWGTTPGLNFVYAHLNRVIRARDLDALFIAGPGHGGPGVVANTYLEGTYSEVYPAVSRDAAGLDRLFTQFSWPGGIPSHAAPETPGSIHEGGELGYALVHAYGAAFDNPGLLVCCVIGDGEAETGALAASWHSNKFLNPRTDGAVLPILHLNGYKIANPTVLARIGDEELTSLLRGYGHEPYFVSGDDPALMHQQMAATLDTVTAEVARIQADAREGRVAARPRWPMIVLRSPKGWTGPKAVDGKPTEGSWRSHQVPLANLADSPEHLRQLEAWLRSYRPESCSTTRARSCPRSRRWRPRARGAWGLTRTRTAACCSRIWSCPTSAPTPWTCPRPARSTARPTRVLGTMLRDVLRPERRRAELPPRGPDETTSNRLDAVFEATDRVFAGEILPTDEHQAPEGRVMEVLSEHLCQGWLEGYLLTGPPRAVLVLRGVHPHRRLDGQPARQVAQDHAPPPVAAPDRVAQLPAHVARLAAGPQRREPPDPGFLDHVVNKKADVVRVYLPPDANCLLSVADHCLRSRHYVNVIVAGKQPRRSGSAPTQPRTTARAGSARGSGRATTAGPAPADPDVVLACAGDVPTMETLAAVDLLRTHVPGLRMRVVNVVDLMTLQPASEHPHGLPDEEFDALFTRDRPIVFAFHGYPSLVHRLAYGGPTTATCTCAASRRRARRRRRSTWSCSTTSTASASRSTCWRGCRGCAVTRRPTPRPPTARPGGPSTAATWWPTATTCPR